MAFVTTEMWQQRIGRLDDVAEFNGAPVAVARMWGRPLVKRFAGEWLTGDHKALPNGREFRLSTASVLRWERHPRPASLPLALDGGDALKETIVIERRPSRTELAFEIDLPAGSMLLYQPPLTAEEIKLGAVRPPEIVGSYAVYGPLGEKIGHLLRPHATDASGRFEWLDLDAIELPNRPGTWRVRILPRSLAWLGEAAWPVTIDPTFGYTAVGGSGTFLSNGYMDACGPYAPASSGNATAAYVYTNAPSANECTLGLYADSSNYPGSLLKDTAGIPGPGGSWAWANGNLDAQQAVAGGTNYWAGFSCNYNSGDNWNVKYDSGAALYYYARTYASGSLAAAYAGGAPSVSWKVSMYVNYEEEAAAGQPFLRRFGGVPFAALNKGVW